MSRLSLTLAAGAALALAGVLSVADPASAQDRYTAVAVANDAKHAVGDTWREILPDGERTTMQKIAPGVTRSVSAVAATVCTGYPYLCAWSTDHYTGNFWRYDMNNVYANTANGVAHCWNLASDANNHQKSWINRSDRRATINNWINCNAAGGAFTFDAFNATNPSDYDSGTCEDVNLFLAVPGQNWCTTYLATSIRASA